MSGKMIKNCAKGLAVSALFGLLLILLFSFICFMCKDPDKYMTVFSFVILAFSAFAGAFFSAKKNKESGIFCGMLTGLFFVLLIFLLSFLFDGNGSVIRYIMYGAMIIISCIGGYLGLPNKKRKKKKAKR